jgi:signal peptidase I
MSFPRDDKTAPLPRLLNAVLSLLLSGSSHFLSGRKLAGVSWFVIVQFLFLVALVTTVSSSTASAMGITILWLVAVVVYVLMMIDSCRRPIQQVNPSMWAAFCLLVVAVPAVKIFAIVFWIGRPFLIPTASMQPTLMGNRISVEGATLKGDHIIVDEWTYHFRPPVRGDIAVFRTDGISELERDRFRIPLNQYYVKRVVGLPGERVAVRASEIYINGQKVADPKISDHISVGTNASPDLIGQMLPDKEIQLGAGEYFVVGDNLMNSLDSRYFGAIHRKFIMGRVSRIFWPPERGGAVQ